MRWSHAEDSQCTFEVGEILECCLVISADPSALLASQTIDCFPRSIIIAGGLTVLS